MQPVRSECKETSWAAFRGVILGSGGVGISLLYMKMLEVLGSECKAGVTNTVSFTTITCSDLQGFVRLYDWFVPASTVMLAVGAGLWTRALTEEAEPELKKHYKKLCITVGVLGAVPVLANFACSFFANPLISTYTRECMNEVVVPDSISSITCKAFDTYMKVFSVSWPILSAVSPPIVSVWSRLYKRL